MIDLSKPIDLNIPNGKIFATFQDHGTRDSRRSWGGSVHQINPCNYEGNEDVRKFFDFTFCWRGVWEGRIYLDPEEIWSEELSDINAAWIEVEKILKQRIKEENPNYKHFDA